MTGKSPKTGYGTETAGLRRGGLFRVLALTAALLLLISAGSLTALAEEKGERTREQALIDEMKRVYNLALGVAGDGTFKGKCGRCVGFQLWSAGIFSGSRCADGNTAYDILSPLTPEPGYAVTLFPGPFKGGSFTPEQVCRILDAANPDGENTYTVFCFNTGSNTDKGLVWGHVMLVHAVYDGMVYWREALSKHNYVLPIGEFAAMYAATDECYHFDGAIWYRKTADAPENKTK